MTSSLFNLFNSLSWNIKDKKFAEGMLRTYDLQIYFKSFVSIPKFKFQLLSLALIC